MKFDHLLEHHYCPLHPHFLQPGERRCMKCGLPLLADAAFAGALRQATRRPAMLYLMLAVMCALLLAVPLLAR